MRNVISLTIPSLTLPYILIFLLYTPYPLTGCSGFVHI